MSRVNVLVYQSTPAPEIEFYFSQQGHSVVVAEWQDLRKLLKMHKIDLCILDITSKKDKFHLIDEIRDIDPDMPIVFLTSTASQEEIISCFVRGVDDFIVRPINIVEVLCRVNAVMKRVNMHNHAMLEEFKIGKFTFNTKRDTLEFEDDSISLTARESAVLKMLCSYRGDTVQRKHILKAIWGDDTYFNARSMDVYITKLRGYFKRDASIKLVNNRGVGLRLFVD